LRGRGRARGRVRARVRARVRVRAYNPIGTYLDGSRDKFYKFLYARKTEWSI